MAIDWKKTFTIFGKSVLFLAAALLILSTIYAVLYVLSLGCFNAFFCDSTSNVFFNSLLGGKGVGGIYIACFLLFLSLPILFVFSLIFSQCAELDKSNWKISFIFPLTLVLFFVDLFLFSSLTNLGGIAIPAIIILLSSITSFILAIILIKRFSSREITYDLKKVKNILRNSLIGCSITLLLLVSTLTLILTIKIATAESSKSAVIIIKEFISRYFI